MNPWDFFDAIYCINLEKDARKREEASLVFARYGIPATFFKGVEDEISNKGCFASHKAIYNLSLEKGHSRVLIFEDDIIPAGGVTPERVKYCTDFMKDHPWDIFYFGAVPSIFKYSQEKSPVKSIYKIRGICTHAYVLNRSALEKLKDKEWEPGAPLDYVIRDDETLEKYAVYPTFFNQRTGYRLPKVLITSGLRANEFYAYNIGIPAKYPLMLLAALVAILILWKFLRRKRSTV